MGPSIWESQMLQASPQAPLDALVVGGGIVGMNAALTLASRKPEWRIAVVDALPLGGGGSTRNAGFTCFGSPSELIDDWRALGPEATVDLVRKRWEGLQALRTMWGDKALGHRACGAVEAFTDEALFEEVMAFLPELNEALEDVFQDTAFHAAPAQSSTLHALCGQLRSPLEGDLNTGAMVQAMREGLDRADVAWWPGLKVEELTDAQGLWTAAAGPRSVSARQVLLATNAFAQDLIDVDVRPVANQVLVSQVMPGLKLDHTVHHDRGYVYVREIEGRLLIGGGRQWDCRDNDEVAERLTAWAQRHVVGCDSFRVAHRWTGQLGIGSSRRPEVKTLKPGLHAGVRLGGMGVAIGTTVGRMLADLALHNPA